MNYGNPTKLKLGYRGTLAGIPFQVVGRVLMGAEDAGTVYYWQEFFLLSDDGKEATLVAEPNDYGVAWKFFTYFDPVDKLSAAEAAKKHGGDRVTIDGAKLRITFCGDSQVYHIEGTAPEGVTVGDVAQYINAERGDKMYVVSWTGEEVEYYRGKDLPPGAVKRAFGLPDEKYKGAGTAGQTSFQSNPAAAGLIVGFIMLFVGVTIYSVASAPTYRRSAALKKAPAGESILSVGQLGTLDGVPYQVIEHRVMEVAAVGKIYDRHEYLLQSKTAERALLVIEPKPRPIALLFREVEVTTPIAPVKAATYRKGDTLNLGDHSVTVQTLSRATVRNMSALGTSARAYDILYQLNAASQGATWLLRWNAEQTLVYQGQTREISAVEEAFRQKPAK